MSDTPPTVTDELFARLLEQLGAPAMVELTAVVAFANLHHARQRRDGHRVPGVLAACELPLAQRSAGSVAGMSDDPFVAPPQPAVHRRLRDARLRRRRRGRRPGDLAAVGRRSTRRRCTTRAPTWSASSPVRRSTGCGRWPPARGVRRRVAAGAAADQPRTSPRTSSSPRASRSRCSPCWRRSRRPSARCSCCARSSTCPYDEIATAVGQVAGGGPPGGAPGPGARGCAAATDAGRPDRAAAGGGAVPRRADSGDVQGLMDVLAPDVVLVADGGGLVAAARQPDRRRGARSWRSWRSSRASRPLPSWTPCGSTVPLGGRIELGRRLDTVVSVVVEDGRITRIYAIRNPHKLARLHEEAELTR